ncbi:MAG: glycosyl transferase [Elusimicrobia bacterium GWA2_56_46]|nr:MAG: glycosyl transferase [Elusimicrobia bacterium GWA2_56_46]OGR54535.1 MAG: glycosyl transferase [Elusimicrobia bacterium GWC2_56_31]HBB68206.1 glycosyl transferase [Elusimicrobiota bacterium]HBW22337.1 glycosyl transferase [Elusimicrobiota bacterium]
MTKAERIKFFDESAGTRDVWRGRNRYYHSELRDFFRFVIPENASVLEIGSGTGDLLAELKPAQALGLDFSPAMTAAAKRRHPELDFAEDDIESLAATEKFDYVVMQDLLGHLDDIWLAFRNLSKVTGPGSRVAITSYNPLWEPLVILAEAAGLKAKNPRQNWLALADIENLLYLNNYEVIKKGYRFLLPFRIPLLSVFFNKFLAKLPFLKELGMIQFIIARETPARPEIKGYSVSVVVPCRDEAGNMERLFRELPAIGKNTELVFVDGNSSDGTVEKIREEAAKHPEIPVKILLQGGAFGKADAVRKGFDAAAGDVLMILDADLTVVPEDLKKFYTAISEGKGEFINGSRLVYPMEKGAMRFLNMLGNKTFSLIFTWTLGQRIKDTLCGTKVLLRSNYDKIKAGRPYFGDFDPFGDFDLLFGASKLNLKIVEVPVGYKERKYGETKISRFRHGLLLFRMSFVAFTKFKLQ